MLLEQMLKKAIDGLTNVPEGVTPFVTDDAIVTPKLSKWSQTPVTVNSQNIEIMLQEKLLMTFQFASMFQ